jgi:acyl-coenzyme A synthetase/AMP-(fatty) acid ligase
MNINNLLAEKLLTTLVHSTSDLSLAKDTSILKGKEFFAKIKQYIEWIDQNNINSVMIISAPSIDALCLCYALVLSNKTYIPVHTSTSAELLNVYLQTYQVDLLLVQPQLINQFNCELKTKFIEDLSKGFFYYMLPQKKKTFCLVPGIVFFTSGTSEQPKAVHYHYNTLSKYLCWCLDEFKLNHADNFLFTTELSFVASLRPLFVPTLAGSNISFLDGNSTNKLQLIINVLVSKKITILNLTPTLFKILLQHIEKNSLLHILSAVRLILLSGEPIDITVINHWFTQINTNTIFYNLYGATEYLVPFYKKINTPQTEADRLHLGQLRAGCDYKLLPHSTKGYELCIAGEISTAYFDEKLTKSNYISIDNRRFIKTNDFIKKHDKELYFCSRSERIIKRYGQLVNLDHIEHVLKNMHNTINFIAFFDENCNNKIYLIISGSLHNEALLKKVKNNLNISLPGYMHPSEYIFTKKLPLTVSGKVDYFLIKKMFVSDQIDEVSDYFKRFFHEKEMDINLRIMDLGLESIDYIEMTDEFLKLTGRWLDISKINNDTRISNITSCLVHLNMEKSDITHAVKLNYIKKIIYSIELNDPEYKNWKCFIASYLLKVDINIERLETAIAETLSKHFILTSKLELRDDDYFFVNTNIQSNFRLRTPIFFPKSTYSKLSTSVHSDRLVRLYIQKKGGHYFLIMAYHHIALDGWSALLVREEIFRRYEGGHRIKSIKKTDEIEYLNRAHQINLNNNNNFNELKSLLLQVNPDDYNHLDPLFHGILEKKTTCFSIEKDSIDHFIRKNKLQTFPYSVVFALLLHQVMSCIAKINKLIFYITFSNRNLPVPHAKDLLTNLATSLPVFLDSTNLTPRAFASQIKENLTVYFKHMSYGELTEIWSNEIINRRFLAARNHPYHLIYTYINKIIDDEYVQNNYIDWDNSTNETRPGNRSNQGSTFLSVYNMGSQFVVTLNSKMTKGLHSSLIKEIKDLVNYPRKSSWNRSEKV